MSYEIILIKFIEVKCSVIQNYTICKHFTNHRTKIWKIKQELALTFSFQWFQPYTIFYELHIKPPLIGLKINKIK